MSKLIRAIGSTHLIAYFEFLDHLRASGQVNMMGAAHFLLHRYPGMTQQEAATVCQAWRETFNTTLPAEDRAMNAMEAA